MSEKSKEQLEEELRVHSLIDKERDKSDKLYAIKIVERIVFGILATVGLAVLYGVLKLLHL